MPQLLRQILLPQGHGPGKARDLGGGLGAGPQAPLLTAAGQQGPQIPQLRCGIQSAGAFWPADLVGGQAHQIHPPAHRIAGDLQKALHRIAVQQGAAVFLPQQAGHLLHREDAARLIVYQHHAHQHRVLPQGLGHLLRRHMAGFVRGQVRHLVPLLLQQLTRLQHGAVLHGGGDDVLAGVASLPDGGLYGPVIRFRAAGGEIQALRRAVQRTGDHGAPILHGFFHLLPRGILGGGIAEVMGQHVVHGVSHGGGYRRGGGIIQIDHGKNLSISWAGGLATGGSIQYNKALLSNCCRGDKRIPYIIPIFDGKCKENPMQAAIYTLGCKVNQYETQAMEQELVRRGHTLVPFDQKADVYIVNTCSVTAVSDKKSRQMIRRCRKLNPNAVVAACGCYVQTHAEEAAGLEWISSPVPATAWHFWTC